MLKNISLKHIGIAILILKFSLISYLILTVLPTLQWHDVQPDFSFLGFVVVGFIAQIIDGTLGMAYGVSCTTFLLNLGVAPKLASAAVHTAEVFTTGVSGLSHIKFNNLDKKLFFRIVITGVAGAVVGAYLVSEIFDGKIIKPYIALYLLILGAVILVKGIRNRPKVHTEVKHAEILALAGGFLDAIGGGGWGPIVTSNIINQGKNPAETIGTVNTAEFFVAFFGTGVFLFFVGVDSWKLVLGLIIGGVIAAPFGAYLAQKISKRPLLIMVGIVIILTSAFTLYKTLWA